MLSRSSQHALSWALAVLMPVTLAGAGCYNRYDVVPTELVKLSNTQSAVVSGVTGSTYVSTGRHSGYVAPTYGTSRVVGETKLVRADGGVALVRGDAGVEVTAGSRTTRFSAPIVAELQGESLVVRGGNGAQAFPLSAIQRATVVEFAPGKTALATTGIALGTVLVLGVVVVVAAGGGH